MKRYIVVILVVAVVMIFMVPMAFAGNGATKVAICHFDGHNASEEMPEVEGELLDGDYVIQYHGGNPLPTWCNTHGGGGEMIFVSVNALDGHGAQLLPRVSQYPTGWRP